MWSQRARAAAWVFCFLVVAVPAAAASRLNDLHPSEAHSELSDRDFGPTGGAERLGFDWVDAVLSGEVTPDQARETAFPDGLSDLVTQAVHPIGVVLSSDAARPHSTVPLPTSLSLFGAGVLTLGLLGFFSSTQRRLSLETGVQFGPGPGPGPPEVAPRTRFKIEVRSERGSQVRHTGSARVAIELIADLLNDGWDMVCISDPNGLPIDYDDVVTACNRERRYV